MNTRERFQAAMNFRPFDRLPMIEWAMWWDKTIDRWHTEGLPTHITDRYDLYRFFGLDVYYQTWPGLALPKPAHHGAPLMASEAEYDALRCQIYTLDRVNLKQWEIWAAEQAKGDAVLWFTATGYFWHPRMLFGIEPHLYAFFDQPKLMQRMNDDLFEWHMKVIERLCSVCTPDFMTFGEDMSYNHGSMISEELFKEFITPCYQRIVPELKKRGIMVVVDSDGDISMPTQWFMDAGVEGMLPLERQAGVDMAEMRRRYPTMRFIGHYDKMVMPHGVEAMRAEFERLKPVAARGGFIASVDHQTPPGVSYQQYMDYLKLYEEFAWEVGRRSGVAE